MSARTTYARRTTWCGLEEVLKLWRRVLSDVGTEAAREASSTTGAILM
jgi:hypothetical protein